MFVMRCGNFPVSYTAVQVTMMFQGDIEMTGIRYAEGFKYQYAGMLCQAAPACYTSCQYFCASGNLDAH